MSDLMMEQRDSNPLMSIRTHFSALWDSGDVLDSLWRVFASPYVTALLFAGLAILVSVGILFPQRPPEAVADPMANGLWMTSVRERYQGATDWLVRAGLLDVHRSLWFRALLGLLAFNFALRVMDSLRPVHLRWPDHPGRTQTLAGELPSVAGRERFLARVRSALRGQGYRLLDGNGGQWMYADRFSSFPLWVYVGLLLVIGGLALSERTAWWEEGVALRPGQLRQLGHGVDLTLRAETVKVSYPQEQGQGHNGRTELTFLRAGREIGREVLFDHAPSFYAGLVFYQTTTEPALLVEARDAAGRHLLLQTPDTGATQFTEVSLRFQEEESPRYIVVLDLAHGSQLGRSFEQAGNEQYVLVPSRDLSLRLVHHSPLSGGPAPTFDVEAFRGAETSPFWRQQVQEAVSVEIEGDTYAFNPQRFAVVKYGQDYGVLLIAVGSVTALVGIVLSAAHPPRRLWLATQFAGDGASLELVGDDSAERGNSSWFDSVTQSVAAALGLIAPDGPRQDPGSAGGQT